MLVSPGVPWNLLPVPSKHSMRRFDGTWEADGASTDIFFVDTYVQAMYSIDDGGCNKPTAVVRVQ